MGGFKPEEGTHPTAESYAGAIRDSGGQIYTNDKFQLGYVDKNNRFDKDVNNHNFAKIEEYIHSMFEVSNKTTLKEQILDLIYPIDSIYISTNSTNPSAYLGGNWEPFSQGTCLFGINTEPGTNTKPQISAEGGGNAEPYQHSHDLDYTGKFCSHTLSTGSTGSHSHRPSKVEGKDRYFLVSSSTNIVATDKRALSSTDNNGRHYLTTAPGVNTTPTINEPQETENAGSHNHTINGYINANGPGSTDVAGSENNIDFSTANLPPYIGVYIWKRVTPPPEQEGE